MMRRIGRGIVYGALIGTGVGLLGGMVLLIVEMRRQSYIGPEAAWLVVTTPVGTLLGGLSGGVHALWR